MTLTTSDLVPYRLPLTEPVVWGGVAYTHREGVLLRLGTEAGAVGWGDAAPLPGFSRESLADTSAVVEMVADALVGMEVEPRDVLPGGSVHDALDAAGLPPSARFALDLALADLAAYELGRTIPQALHPDPAVSLPLNGLVMGEGAAAVGSARALAEAGYPAVKLKIGRGTVAVDVARVRAVRDVLPATVALRLDANQAWTWDQALAFADGIAGVALDYLEEPLAEPARMPELWHDTGLPLALDESVQARGGEASIRGWAAAVVLKPTLVGGVSATLRLATAARAVGVRPVLSAAFESGVGLRGVAALAAATGAEPAGLDTYRWLAADVLPPLPFGRPRVGIPGLFGDPLEVRVP